MTHHRPGLVSVHIQTSPWHRRPPSACTKYPAVDGMPTTVSRQDTSLFMGRCSPTLFISIVTCCYMRGSVSVRCRLAPCSHDAHRLLFLSCCVAWPNSLRSRAPSLLCFSRMNTGMRCRPNVEGPQERRGRHKGLICAIRNCQKFARLTDKGLRRSARMLLVF